MRLLDTLIDWGQARVPRSEPDGTPERAPGEPVAVARLIERKRRRLRRATDDAERASREARAVAEELAQMASIIARGEDE